MPSMTKLIVVSMAALAVATSACARETAMTGEAPELEASSLDEKDEGASFNGWTQSPSYHFDDCDGGDLYLQSTFARSYGDATRGGGVCYVEHEVGTSCSSDASCTGLAQAQWGGGAFGYCYSGTCFTRPGAANQYCLQNPNRSAGTVGLWVSGNKFQYALGCMTKTAGPNTACGGTNSSLYMRTVVQGTYSMCNDD
jgi:hypothetical protein